MVALAVKWILSIGVLIIFCAIATYILVVVACMLKLKLFGRRFLVFDFWLDAMRYAESHPDEKFTCYIKYDR